MRKKHKHTQILLMIGYATILSMITFLLLWTAEPGSFGYWITIGVVAICWCIFFLVSLLFAQWAMSRLLPQKRIQLLFF